MYAAYYSKTCASLVQYCIYEDITGKEIKITEIVEVHCEPISKHFDLKFVGFVEKLKFKSTHLSPIGEAHEALMNEMENDLYEEDRWDHRDRWDEDEY